MRAKLNRGWLKTALFMPCNHKSAANYLSAASIPATGFKKIRRLAEIATVLAEYPKPDSSGYGKTFIPSGSFVAGSAFVVGAKPLKKEMKMKTVRIVMATALTALLAQVEAGVIVDLQSISSSTSQDATFSNLNATVTSDNAFMNVSGSLSASDMGSGETFYTTFTGVSDWNYAAAAGAGNVNLGDLTSANIDGGNGGWGTVAGTKSTLDVTGEALVVAFDLSGLTAAHQADFRLTTLDIGRFDPATEVYNYMFLDASGDIIVSGSAQTDAALSVDLALNDGDFLVIGHEAGDFTFNGFSVDVIPEPATLGLIVIGSVGMLLGRRKFIL